MRLAKNFGPTQNAAMPVSPELRTKLQQATDDLDVVEWAKNDRETYRLACCIVDKLEPEESIARLEIIGEEKLRHIFEWLKETT
jgi:hypothetical protein